MLGRVSKIMSKYKFDNKVLLGATVLSFSVAAAFPTYAQDNSVDSAELVEEVVVSGIRSSIRNSLDLKKEETSIIEAISAEDIGKLPDVSIADSLARLPGVTAQRVRGRAQQISIRGLGPDFSIALLNGREVVSAGNNRGIEFDQFPSELVATGVVYKTPDAKLAATGIAGAVDLRTVRPLDYKERKINASAKFLRNSNGSLNPDFDDTGNRLFASYIDQNAAGSIGWSLGVTSQSNPTQFTSRELKTNQGQVSIDPATGLVYPSDNPRTGVVSREFERTSVAGTLQFEPSDRLETTIDLLFTDTEDSGIFRGLETPIASWSGAQFEGTTGSSGFADSATFSAVVPILRTDTEGNTAEIFAAGVNTVYSVNDRLTLTADLSTSTLDREDVDYESYAGTGGARSGAQDTLTFNTPANGQYSIDSLIDYTDPNNVYLTDPGGWGQVGFIKQPQIEDELNQLRLEADYAMDNSFISGFTGGVIITDREKSFNSNENFLRAGTGFVATDASNPSTGRLAIPSVVGSTDSGNIGLDIVAYNPATLLTDGTYILDPANDVAWTVEEEINTLYGQVNFDSVLNTIPVRGNLGFQYVDVNQSSTGTLAGSGQQTVEDDYTHFLPSLNLSFEMAENTFIRAAAAKTVTRPRLDQLAANQSINLNTTICPDANPADGVPDAVLPSNNPNATCFNLGGGNPFLRPYESTSVDLAFEKYFGDASALSIAVFSKDLSNWVNDRSTLVDASQQIIASGNGDFLAANPGVATTNLGGPVNFDDGEIQGFEATLRVDLDDIAPGKLSGFGFNASYTHAANELTTEDGDDISIPGYSEDVWSSDLYYENYGWRARISARHRSDFLSEIQEFDGSLNGQQALDETIVDAQIGYEWDAGTLEGFSINFEAYNLTDEPFATENEIFNGAGGSEGTFISRYEKYGTTYNITIAKKF